MVKKFVYVHVCAECGESHCGCPDPTERHGAPNGYFSYGNITLKVDDDVSTIEKSSCKGDAPWPCVIGTTEIEV